MRGSLLLLQRIPLWVIPERSIPPCVILSAGRSPESNFCGMAYPLRKQDTK